MSTALRTAILKALRDAIDEELEAERATTLSEVRQVYEAYGAKSFDVRLSDSTKVASISLAIPKAEAAVTGPAELDAFIEATYPHAMLIVPASRTVSPAFREEFLRRLEFIDGTPVTPEGEVVPGVEYRAAGEPKSFSVRFEKTGRERIARAWALGQFGALMPGMAPQLPEAR